MAKPGGQGSVGTEAAPVEFPLYKKLRDQAQEEVFVSVDCQRQPERPAQPPPRHRLRRNVRCQTRSGAPWPPPAKPWPTPPVTRRRAEARLLAVPHPPSLLDGGF